MPRGRMITKPCRCCGELFHTRAADIARGWGLFCSKRCKAKQQARMPPSTVASGPEFEFDDLSWDAHKADA